MRSVRWVLAFALLALAGVLACGAPDGAIVGINDEPAVNPEVAMPCPAGFTAQQCLRMNQAAIFLMKMTGSQLCALGGQRFMDQLQGDQSEMGVKFETGGGPNLMGASYQISETGEWANWTGITALALSSSDAELRATIAHEVIGHQTLNYGRTPPEEAQAEIEAYYCANGGEY